MGYLRRHETQSARAEAARFRQLLIQQQVAEQFAQVPQLSLDLSRAVNALQWNDATEAALRLSSELATLKGADRIEFVVGSQHIFLIDTTLAMLGELNRRVARMDAGTEVPELAEACHTSIVYVHTIRRAITSRAALGGDNDGK